MEVQANFTMIRRRWTTPAVIQVTITVGSLSIYNSRKIGLIFQKVGVYYSSKFSPIIPWPIINNEVQKLFSPQNIAPESKKSIFHQVLQQRSVLLELKLRHSRQGRLKICKFHEVRAMFFGSQMTSTMPSIYQAHNKSLWSEHIHLI